MDSTGMAERAAYLADCLPLGLCEHRGLRHEFTAREEDTRRAEGVEVDSDNGCPDELAWVKSTARGTDLNEFSRVSRW